DLLGTESAAADIKVTITNDADELPVVAKGQNFSIIESAAEGTVIGLLDHGLFESAATMVTGGTVANTNLISINNKGELVVTGSLSYYATPTMTLD
ncbi:hypothetical protein, partial [Enterococcus faecium]|uniref:hypothetical protein n=1 Tax=Enterococcus faecium TaxID=1352 RepID=UPI0034E93DCD